MNLRVRLYYRSRSSPRTWVLHRSIPVGTSLSPAAISYWENEAAKLFQSGHVAVWCALMDGDLTNLCLYQVLSHQQTDDDTSLPLDKPKSSSNSKT